jgi:hypothetical protein
VISDFRDTIIDYNRRQVGTVLERTVPEGGYPAANIDIGEQGAFIERIVPDRSYAVRDRDAG